MKGGVLAIEHPRKGARLVVGSRTKPGERSLPGVLRGSDRKGEPLREFAAHAKNLEIDTLSIRNMLRTLLEPGAGGARTAGEGRTRGSAGFWNAENFLSGEESETNVEAGSGRSLGKRRRRKWNIRVPAEMERGGEEIN